MTRFDFARPSPGLAAVLAMVGARPRACHVDVEAETLEVRLGPAFSARLDRGSLIGARRDTGPVTGWGAHGWRGHWLVNTAASGLVRLRFEPAGRARVVGVPVRVRDLRLSLADPDGFLAATAPGARR